MSQVEGNGKERIHIATTVERDDELHNLIQAESETLGVSVSAIVRWALRDRYEAQRQQAEAARVPVGTVTP